MKRNPEISVRNAESICRGRTSLTKGCIRGWFDDARKFFEERNILYVLENPASQYNTDETGFQLDPKAGKILARKGEMVYTEAGGLKEQVTVLVTTRADGKICTSVIIYPYKKAVQKNIVDNIPDGFCVGRSDSGWMKCEVFFEFISNVFLP